MQVDLRAITPDEWELWRAIRLEALADAPYAFSSRLATWRSAPEERWRERLGLADSHNLVAFTEGRAVGMATGMPAEERGVAELVSMYVARSVRGRGVGDLLVGAVEQWAVGRGFGSLCLEVVADNGPARRLYERHGLVVVGAATPPGKSQELWMCKKLDPPGPPVPPSHR